MSTCRYLREAGRNWNFYVTPPMQSSIVSIHMTVGRFLVFLTLSFLFYQDETSVRMQNIQNHSGISVIAQGNGVSSSVPLVLLTHQGYRSRGLSQGFQEAIMKSLSYSQERCPMGTMCWGRGIQSHKTFIDFYEKNELRKTKCWPLFPSDTSSFSQIKLRW